MYHSILLKAHVSAKLARAESSNIDLFFVGIGGNGMYPLACLAHTLGYGVAGSDERMSENVLRLKRKGIPVSVGECLLPPETDALVRTLAVAPTHPACLEAEKNGIPIFTRAELLSLLERRFPVRIAVSGSHGKSSTVGMCAEILRAAKLDPTVLVGADLSFAEGGFRAGKGDILLYEACEYGNSFLSFFPTHAAVLNAEWEHTDFFESENAVITSFRHFLEKTSVRYRLKKAGMPFEADVDFGENGLFHAKNVFASEGKYTFSLYREKENLGVVKLGVIGVYQIDNALAAAALSLAVGADVRAVQKGLSSFLGVGGRMEYKGKLGPSSLYLDYAHHPSELAACLSAAKKLGKRIAFVFEPHTYSRVASFEKEYVKLLAGEKCGVLPIYAAREENVYGVSAKALAEKCGAVFLPDFAKAAEFLLQNASPGTVLLLIGAGNVARVTDGLPLTV